MPVCKLATDLEIWQIAVLVFDSRTTYHEASQLPAAGALLGEAGNITVSAMLRALGRT